MKKVIKMSDLDIVKQQKEMEKKIVKAFERRCFICYQKMEYIDSLVWYCKRCDTLTAISNLISFKNNETGFRRTAFIEKE